MVVAFNCIISIQLCSLVMKTPYRRYNNETLTLHRLIVYFDARLSLNNIVCDAMPILR